MNNCKMDPHSSKFDKKKYVCVIQDYTKTLKLTGCAENEFTCKNGQCLPMVRRCNQIVDCEDKTDEDNCVILDFEGNYQKSTPPIESTIGNDMISAYVNVSIDFLKMVKTEEVNNKIMIKLNVVC